ncbi:hypothetical protein ALC57_16561 [Trachymyrmex cornetzi]|uniref:DNA-directed DNA polymerase n=1 Tax=Trachymyrmex cornetzi TaxID=471704 RepID=A0A151IUV7_9HYME|nr:hypothetical protein ALC57_16561 [Trachymyrmex cornetzi]
MENHERVERELLEQCGQVATLVECFAWLQRCDECIERLEELCRAKRPRLAVGHRQSMVARIARLAEDAREIMLERVRDAIERHGSVKVNTALNGEFATKDKRAIKSINTKNIEIYRCTDIRECTSDKLELHAMDCRKINDCAIRLPSEVDKWLEFDNHRNKERIPFVTHAKNDFEKNLYKLMNNAVFGKTMENVRNHFNKPIYVGMCILDISKVCLYEFHYDYMLPLFHDKCKIMYTDTDSLIYRVECENIYETIKRDIARFDTSDYPADKAYGMSLVNKKLPGLVKDENNGMIRTEFVGLRAKMYEVRVDGKNDTKKAKDVKSNVVARTITFDDYTRCLNQEMEMTRCQSCIRSKLHEVYTISESKIALSPYDDKRYVIPDSTETLPWGHWRIPL